MPLKKINDADVSFKRWNRTLVEAFGPDAKLHVEPKRNGPREYAWMAVCGVCIGIVWYGCFVIGVTR
jgi:hypothetical protein